MFAVAVALGTTVVTSAGSTTYIGTYTVKANTSDSSRAADLDGV
jgi:hypothetical protein